MQSSQQETVRRLLTIDEVAEMWGVCRRTIMRLIDRQELPYVLLHGGKRKRLIRVRVEIAERFVMEHEVLGKAATPVAPVVKHRRKSVLSMVQ